MARSHRASDRVGVLGAVLVVSAVASSGCVSAALDIPESENPASVHGQAAPLPDVARALREDPVPLPSRSAMHHHGAMQHDAGAAEEGHAMPHGGAREGHATPDTGAGR